MADANLDDLVNRIKALEMAQARAHAGGVVLMDDTSHHPRPGTWAGDERKAMCRYCDLPIWGDEAGRWWSGRDETCHARAAGAAAKD